MLIFGASDFGPSSSSGGTTSTWFFVKKTMTPKSSAQARWDVLRKAPDPDKSTKTNLVLFHKFLIKVFIKSLSNSSVFSLFL